MARPYLFQLVDASDPRSVQRSQEITFMKLGQKAAAPDLIPLKAFDPKSPSQDQIELIDVVNDFEWTHTPSIGRHEVPFIRLSEYRVNFNSLIQNIRYLLTMATGATTKTDPYTGLPVKEEPKEGEQIKPGSTSWFKKLKGSIKGITPSTLEMKDIAEYLKPYVGLYDTTPTGFEYYFPYFESQWKGIRSQWGDTEGGGMFGSLLDMFGPKGTMTSLADTALSVDKSAIGAYIERPKMFSYSGENTQKLKFTLTLLNTTSQDDIVRNWHLAFMLAYQNLPNRTSKVFLEPPVIYEVEIPGLFYTPFAYISNLTVVNRGATRLLKIPYYNKRAMAEEAGIPSVFDQSLSQARWDRYTSDRSPKFGSKQLWNQIVKTETYPHKDRSGAPKLIETIIPDAYQIEIEITSLIPESKNLFYHSALGSGTLGRGIYTATTKNGIPKLNPGQTDLMEATRTLNWDQQHQHLNPFE